MTLFLWIAFIVFVLILLVLDLGVFHRRRGEMHLGEAVGWTLFWVGLALAFSGGVYLTAGSGKALEFLTGYAIEKSLSLDNLFVFLVLFSTFRVDPKDQHKILFWGVLAALVLRGAFIVGGVALTQSFHGVFYLLGLALLFAGIRTLFKKSGEILPGHVGPNLMAFLGRVLPVSDQPAAGRLVIRSGRRLQVTSLFIVLLFVEIADALFALESIPAVLAVSDDPFIIYTSNVFAILGLRSLYFALAGLLPKFHYLHYGLSGILILVGTKMLVSEVLPIPLPYALGGVGFLIVGSVIASLLWPPVTRLLRPTVSG